MNSIKTDMDNSFEYKQWGDWDDNDISQDEMEFSEDDYDDVIEDNRRYVTGKLKSFPAPKPIALKSIEKIDNNYITSKGDEKHDNEYKEVMKTKLNWLTKPTVVEVVYDSDESEYEEAKTLKSVISDDEYPSLSSEIFKQNKKEFVKKEESILPKEDNGIDWMKVSKKKKIAKDDDSSVSSSEFTKPCLTWIEGTKCNRKGCTYAHSEKELKINDCNFKNCNMVIEKDGYFLNKNSDRFCNKIHRHELVDNFLERLGVKKIKMVKYDIPEELNYALSLLPKEKYIEFEGVKYFGQLKCDIIEKKEKTEEPKKKEKTQMCHSVKEKTKCPHKSNCRYAHNFDELVVSLCGFNEKCRGVNQDNRGNYLNATNGKVCCYRHPGETKDNYRKRVNV
jgi:hypothetical protein